MKKILFIILIILSSCVKEDNLEYHEMIFQEVLLPEKVVVMYDTVFNIDVFIPYSNSAFDIDILFLAQLHGNPRFTMIYDSDNKQYYRN